MLGEHIQEVFYFNWRTAQPHFRGHAAEATALAYRPGYLCANFLLSASFDCTLRAWDARNTSVLAVYATPGPVESLAVPNASDSNVHDTVYISCWHRRKNQLAGGGRVHVYSLGRVEFWSGWQNSLYHQPVISHLSGFLGTFERNTVLIWPLVHRDGKQLSNRSLLNQSDFITRKHFCFGFQFH